MNVTRALVTAVLAAVSLHSGLAQEQQWYRGNTHVHAFKTPAAYPPELPTQWYSAHGFDFIVQTEHEWIVDPASIATPKGFLLIAGQEITQAVVDDSAAIGVRHTHVNGLGLSRVIMPVSRTTPNASALPVDEMWRKTAAQMTVAESIRRNVEQVREQAGVAQVNHPNLHWSVKPSDLLGIDGPYLLEIWNAFPRAVNNLGGIADNGEATPSTEALWDELLSAGKVVWGVASDDAHDYEHFDNPDAPTPGKGWLMVRAAALTRDAILTALRRGNFYASTGVYLKDVSSDAGIYSIRMDFPPRDVGYGARKTRFETTFIGRHGRVLLKATGSAADYRLRGDEGYVRAVITDSDGHKAWTQPLFVDGRVVTTPR